MLLFLFATSLSARSTNALVVIPTSVKISLPLDRTIFQQDKLTGTAQFVLAGQVLGYYPAGTTVQFQIESLDKMGNFVAINQSFTNLSCDATGFYNTTLTLSTGWYRITVQLGSQSTSIKVGVGEVLFVAGQSNAQGIDYGDYPNLGSNYDCINAVNQNGWCKKTYEFPEFLRMEYSASFKVSKIAPNGNQSLWAYQALGKQIVDRSTTTVIPVMVFNAASTGTSVDNWSQTAGDATHPNGEIVITTNPLLSVQNCQLNNSDWNSEGPEGHPYRGLRTALNYYGGMLGARSVIWHQGESDNKLRAENSLDAANYTGKLQNVIDKTRLHFNSNLSWAISRVSRFTTLPSVPSTINTALLADQTTVKNSGLTNNTTWGAYYSDDIDGLGTNRVDGLHFSAAGLLKLAELYATGNFTGNTAGGTQGGAILTMQTVKAMDLAPTVTVTVSGGLVTMTANKNGGGTFDSYRWVKNESKMNTFVASTQTLTGIANTGSDRYRCYVTDALGNVLISQEVALPIEQGIVLGICSTSDYTPYSDQITCNEVSGWVFKSAGINTPATVKVYVDNMLKYTAAASVFKPIGPVNTNEGYIIPVPTSESWKDGLSHTIKVNLCDNTNSFATNTVTCPVYALLSISGQTGLTNASATGGTGLFTVSSINSNWSITGVPSWATVTPTSGGNGSSGITVTFSNNTGATRSATLSISGNNGVTTQTVPISQQGVGSSCVSCQGNTFNDNDLIGYGNGVAVRVVITNGCAKAYWSGGNGNSFVHQNWIAGLTGKTVSDAVLNSCISWDGIPSNCANDSPCGGSCTSPTPSLSANPTSISAGQSSTLTATGCTGIVSWSNGTTGSTTTVTSAGTYTATCTNSGCTVSSAGSVTVNSIGTVTCVTCQNTTFSDNDLIGYGNGVAVRIKIENGCAKAYWSGGNGNSLTHQNWIAGLTNKTISDAILNSCVTWDGIPSNCSNDTPCGGGCVGGNFTGHLDGANCSYFNGWSFDWNDLTRTVKVDIYVDGTKVATVDANEERGDLVTAFGGNNQCRYHGFTYYAPANAWWKNGANHVITAKPCGSTQDLGSTPKNLSCSPGSRISFEASYATEKDVNATFFSNESKKENEDDFRADPNPSTGSITVYFVGENTEIGHLKVVDVLGREILQLSIPANRTTIIEMPAEFSGTAFFNLQTNNFIKNRKVLIVK